MSLNPAFYCVCWRCTRQGIMGTAVNKAASREGYQQMAHKYSCSVGLQPVQGPEAWCSPGSPVAPTAGTSWMHLPPSLPGCFAQKAQAMALMAPPCTCAHTSSAPSRPWGLSIARRASGGGPGAQQCLSPPGYTLGSSGRAQGLPQMGFCPFHVGRNRLGSGWLSGGVA